MKSMKLNIAIIITLFFTQMFAQDCVDDVTGAFEVQGGCEMVLSWGLDCGAMFAGVLIEEECPLSCDNCPPDCETNGPTSHGCCLPDINLYINEDGKVYFNSSEDIAGFQFTVQGATVLGVSGGDAAIAEYNISSNSETGMVLGYSLTGTSINNTGSYVDNPAGGACGTLLEVQLDGTPTGLRALVITDPVGELLTFRRKDFSWQR